VGWHSQGEPLCRRHRASSQSDFLDVADTSRRKERSLFLFFTTVPGTAWVARNERARAVAQSIAPRIADSDFQVTLCLHACLLRLRPGIELTLGEGIDRKRREKGTVRE
jgi:hypothetical protein